MISVSDYHAGRVNSRNIIPVHSDARILDLPSNFFDGVYSSGSIEHFGGLKAVESASIEIARILKPGGVASISTEFRLDGPVGKAWFDDNCILFTPELLRRHILEPSGLTAIGFPSNIPSSKTFESQKVLLDFLHVAKNVKTFEDKCTAYPNLVLSHDGFLFCSVHILLQKPFDWEISESAKAKVGEFRRSVANDRRAAIKTLKDGLALKGASPKWNIRRKLANKLISFFNK